MLLQENLNLFSHCYRLPWLWGILLALSLTAIIFVLKPLSKQCQPNIKWFKRLFVPIFLMTSWGLYQYWGASSYLVHQQATQHLHEQLALISQQQPTKDKLLVALTQLSTQIDYSHIALARLGTLYTELGLLTQSNAMLEKAISLAPDEYAYQIQWIYNQSLAEQGKLSALARNRANAILNTLGFEKSLINLLAIDDYFQGNYSRAIIKWQLLLDKDQELTSERRLVLHNAIESAQKHLGVDPVSIAVTVSLKDTLQSHVSPDDVVFVVVKRVQGSPVPLAVIKKSAKDLPFTINLDDKHSMIAGENLSQALTFPVKIIAKISKSGMPQEEKGDLRGTSPKIMLKSGSNQLQVTINETV